ncbi:uncharacterized protein [Chelonus insularis]|uniref:uncharacterized protein n=1 Tax=Chelonus insularis TaxID=460826 RepID=UPI00158EBABB|nr:uncharacterized protein LOC118074659 [Chelonus insularis]
MADDASLSDEINELIKTDGELEDELASQLQILEKWKKIHLSLNCRNLNKTNILGDITKENECLREKIKKLTSDYEDYSNKVKLVKSNQSKQAEATWQRFMEDSQQYQHFIKSAQIEYKSENLNADIHRYEVIHQELSNQSLNVIRNMEELTEKYGLDELGTNVKAKQLKEIQSFNNLLKQEQLPISIKIKNDENKKNSLIQKIKRKESDTNNLINQRKL